MVTHNKARSGIQGRRGTMIVCTENSIWRTRIRKEHPETIGHLSVVQKQNSSYFSLETLRLLLAQPSRAIREVLCDHHFPCLPGSLCLVLGLTAPRASQTRLRLLPWRGTTPPPLRRASSVARAFAWPFASCCRPPPELFAAAPAEPPPPRRRPVTSHRCSQGRGWSPGRGAPTVCQSGACARGAAPGRRADPSAGTACGRQGDTEGHAGSEKVV